MKKERGFIGVGVLIATLVGLAVLGGMAYYVMRQQSALQTTSGNNLDNLPNTHPSNSAPTKTYSDKQISFSYPSNFSIRNPNVPGSPDVTWDNSGGTDQVVSIGALSSDGLYREIFTVGMTAYSKEDAHYCTDASLPGPDIEISDKQNVMINGVSFLEWGVASYPVRYYRILRGTDCYTLNLIVAPVDGGSVRSNQATDAALVSLEAVAKTFQFVSTPKQHSPAPSSSNNGSAQVSATIDQSSLTTDSSTLVHITGTVSGTTHISIQVGGSWGASSDRGSITISNSRWSTQVPSVGNSPFPPGTYPVYVIDNNSGKTLASATLTVKSSPISGGSSQAATIDLNSPGTNANYPALTGTVIGTNKICIVLSRSNLPQTYSAATNAQWNVCSDSDTNQITVTQHSWAFLSYDPTSYPPTGSLPSLANGSYNVGLYDKNTGELLASTKAVYWGMQIVTGADAASFHSVAQSNGTFYADNTHVWVEVGRGVLEQIPGADPETFTIGVRSGVLFGTDKTDRYYSIGTNGELKIDTAPPGLR